jgi:hypothetical protein
VPAAIEDVLWVIFGTLSVLLGAWALWLLLTEDPDGGRHPVGGIMLTVAVLLALVAAALLKRRSVRRRVWFRRLGGVGPAAVRGDRVLVLRVLLAGGALAQARRESLCEASLLAPSVEHREVRVQPALKGHGSTRSPRA